MSAWSRFEGLSPYVKEKLGKVGQLDERLVDEVFKACNVPREIAQKVFDLDLWFLLHYQLKKPIDKKFTGRLFEIVAESVLRASRLDFEFVDYDPVD